MMSLMVLIAFGVTTIQGDVPLNEQMSKLVVQYRNSCLQSSQVDLELLEKARKGDFSKNADFRKHVYCVAKKAEFLDNSGNLQYNVIRPKATVIYNNDNERVEELMATCVLPGEDPIEVSAQVQLNPQMAQLIIRHRDLCLKSSNVDLDLLEKARKGDFSSNADFRKHIYCVSKEIGFQDSSGHVQNDVLMTKSTIVYKDNKRARELFERCAVQNEDPIETAVKMFKCYNDEGDLVIL